MMNFGIDHMWTMGWFWLIGIVAFILVIWLTFKLADRRDRSEMPGVRSAEDILKERYARDEISREEYLEKKHDLE